MMTNTITMTYLQAAGIILGYMLLLLALFSPDFARFLHGSKMLPKEPEKPVNEEIIETISIPEKEIKPKRELKSIDDLIKVIENKIANGYKVGIKVSLSSYEYYIYKDDEYTKAVDITFYSEDSIYLYIFGEKIKNYNNKELEKLYNFMVVKYEEYKKPHIQKAINKLFE